MKSLPLTVRRSIELIGLYIIAVIIMKGSQILTPLVIAFFISIVLLPVYRFFIRKKLPNVLAIVLSVFLFLLVVILISWFVFMQAAALAQDFPSIQKNIAAHANAVSAWIYEKTNWSVQKQTDFFNTQSQQFFDYTGKILSGAFVSISSVFIFAGLLPVYTFLILLYKDILLRFIYLWFPAGKQAELQEVSEKIEKVIKSYITGLLIQISYITVLLGGTLLIIGIKHALLIGIIFALLNLVPYIGALIGNLIAVLLTLSSSQEIWPVINVLITIAAVQFLDNNILMPRIVGGKVQINALAALVGVFTGGYLAGIAGMFLALPVIAVLKIIFDHTQNFKQWGVLFGDVAEQKRMRIPFAAKKPNAAAKSNKS